jgi:hypothetical protein
MFESIKHNKSSYKEFLDLYTKFQAGKGFLNRQIARRRDIGEDKARFIREVEVPMDRAWHRLTPAERARFNDITRP